MARKKKARDGLFKKQRTNYAVKGKRWYNGQPVNQNTPGAVAVTTESEEWYTRITDKNGRRTEHKLARDKSAALIMRGELLRKVEMRQAGADDPFEAHTKRTLADHLADFEQHLVAKGNVPKHVANTLARIRSVCSGCKFNRLADLNASKAEAFIADRRKPAEDGTPGLSITSSNHLVVALKSFGNWLLRNQRHAINPFAHMSRQNADTDVRHARRPLIGDELARLVCAAEANAREFRGLSGAFRGMLYRVASLTGLRASELASLTDQSFDLRANPPTVTVEACYSKHGRKDVLPLHPELVSQLASWLPQYLQAAGDEPAVIRIHEKREPVALWPGTWAERGADMLRIDLAKARADWLKEVGRDIAEQLRRVRTTFLHYETRDGFADFHSLRHGFITTLATSGVHPKTAQELARHSTITLTMDRYSHVGLGEMNEALKSVKPLPRTGTGN